MTVGLTEETAVVTLTDAAAAKLRSIMAEKNLSDYGLRVFVQGGGCSGFQYGMTFDNNPRDVDIVFEQAGLRMIVDPRSIDYIAGANIDYVDSLMGGGFQIDNPNAVSTCGCGNSFRTKDENGEEVAGGCSSCR